jgi:peptidoglycan/xylan/chitin deacetylase (PgdA/CDA1 family)
MNIPVLMYHRVCASTETARVTSDFVVAEATLRKQLTYLSARGYRTPSVTQALEAVDAVEARRSVLLTFDDGYLDNYAIALPILQELGFTATVFVLANATQRVNFWDYASATASAALMGPAEIRAMVDAGITIGSHGISHRRLDALSDEEARRELVASKALLEDLTGKPVDLFAYPFGVVTPRLKDMVRDAGYLGAFAVNSGPFDFQADPYEIRRVLVGNHADDGYLYAKVSGLEKAARSTTDIWRRLLSLPVPRAS